MAQSDSYKIHIQRTNSLVKSLAESIGIEEKAAGFKKLTNSSTASLLNHRFLDVQEKQVLRSIKGIGEKLLLAGLPKSSERLMHLVTELLGVDPNIEKGFDDSRCRPASSTAHLSRTRALLGHMFDEDNGPVSYAVLHLILLLSQRPSSQSIPGAVAEGEQSATNDVADKGFGICPQENQIGDGVPPDSDSGSEIISWKDHMESDSDLEDWDNNSSLSQEDSDDAFDSDDQEHTDYVPKPLDVQFCPDEQETIAPVFAIYEAKQHTVTEQPEGVSMYGKETAYNRPIQILFPETLSIPQNIDEDAFSCSPQEQRYQKVKRISRTEVHGLPNMHPSGLCSQYGDHVFQNTGILLEAHMMSEAEVIRGVLGMFQGNACSLFHQVKNESQEMASQGLDLLCWRVLPKFNFTSDYPVCVAHLSPAALRSYIDRFVAVGNAVVYLRLFVKLLTTACYEGSSDSPMGSERFGTAMQAFSAAVHDLVTGFEQQVAAVEAGFYSAQKGQTTNTDIPLTLIGLEKYFDEYSNCLHFAMELIERCMGWWWSDYNPEKKWPQGLLSHQALHHTNTLTTDSAKLLSPLRERTKELLSGLYEALVELELYHNDLETEQLGRAHKKSFLHDWLCVTFQKTITPYVSSICRWILQGELSDPFCELFFSHDDVQQTSFQRESQVLDHKDTETSLACASLIVHHKAIPIFFQDHFAPLGRSKIVSQIVLGGYDVKLMKSIPLKEVKAQINKIQQQFEMSMKTASSLLRADPDLFKCKELVNIPKSQFDGEDPGREDQTQNVSQVKQQYNFVGSFLMGTAEYLLHADKFLQQQAHPAMVFLELNGSVRRLEKHTTSEVHHQYSENKIEPELMDTDEGIQSSTMAVGKKENSPLFLLGFQNDLLIPLSDYSLQVNSLCASVFLKDLKILRFLSAVRSVFSFGHAKLVDHFQLSIFSLLTYIFHCKQPLVISGDQPYFKVNDPVSFLQNPQSLSSLFQSSLQAATMEFPDNYADGAARSFDTIQAFMHDLPGTSVNLSDLIRMGYTHPEEKALQPIKYLGRIQVESHWPWPYHLFLPPSANKKYNNIMNLVLQVKFAKKYLEAVQKKQRHVLAYSGFQVNFSSQEDKRHVAMIWLSQILHVVRILHNYIIGQACSATLWDSLKERLEKAESLWEMVEIHNATLLNIEERCFLLSRSKIIRLYLLEILQCGLDFVGLYETYLVKLEVFSESILLEERKRSLENQRELLAQGETNQSSTLKFHSKEAKGCFDLFEQLQSLHSEFLKNVTFINAIFEEMVNSRLAPYLEEMLLHLNYNFFVKNALVN